MCGLKKRMNWKVIFFIPMLPLHLKNVAVYILKGNNNNSSVDSIVTRVDPQYYTVQINDKIDSVVLVSLLKRELLAQQIKTDFEYSVYDCESEKMKYGRYVSFSNNDKPDDIVPTVSFRKIKRRTTILGFIFRSYHTFLTKEMSSWFASTFVLILFYLIIWRMRFLSSSDKKD
jgi:two-component system phosphate regulon sensor histidine kinase PhoR